MQKIKFITERISAEINEINVGNMISACKIPTKYNERGISEVLKGIVADANIPVDEWTVQERYACLLQYMMASDGDLEVANGLRFSDFLTDIAGSGDRYTFEMVEGDERVELEVQPLTGKYIEAIEAIVLAGGINGSTSREAWELCCMAAQIVVKDAKDEGVIQELVHQRALSLLKEPLSNYEFLRTHWLEAKEQMAHLIDYSFDDGGVICISNRAVLDEESGVSGFMPARFCFYALFRDGAHESWGTAD